VCDPGDCGVGGPEPPRTGLFHGRSSRRADAGAIDLKSQHGLLPIFASPWRDRLSRGLDHDKQLDARARLYRHVRCTSYCGRAERPCGKSIRRQMERYSLHEVRAVPTVVPRRSANLRRNYPRPGRQPRRVVGPCLAPRPSRRHRLARSAFRRRHGATVRQFRRRDVAGEDTGRILFRSVERPAAMKPYDNGSSFA